MIDCSKCSHLCYNTTCRCSKCIRESKISYRTAAIRSCCSSSAALISAAVGLHAKCIGSTSWSDHWWSKIRVQVTVLDAVLELPQASMAVNVLTLCYNTTCRCSSASEKVRLVTATAAISSCCSSKCCIDLSGSWITCKCIGSTSWRDHWWSKIR
jgi:hypothetical protein